MIESLLALVTDPSYPSLHVLIVHFPIALICLAPLFDLACLALRDKIWIDRTASVLYLTGTISAGAAYLSGKQPYNRLYVGFLEIKRDQFAA